MHLHIRLKLKHVFGALILLFLVSRVHCLSDGEITALTDFLALWPGLEFQTPPWTANVSEACNEPVFYGLECTSGPVSHVTSMYAHPF